MGTSEKLLIINTTKHWQKEKITPRETSKLHTILKRGIEPNLSPQQIWLPILEKIYQGELIL